MKIKSLKRLKRRIQRKCGYFYHWGEGVRKMSCSGKSGKKKKKGGKKK
jgi:hypothetical protein